VIKGDVQNKKVRSQAMVGLLTRGRLFDYFLAKEVKDINSDQKVFILEPKESGNGSKRVEMTVSISEKRIDKIRFWDDRENETGFVFSEVRFGKKVDQKLFKFEAPADADVMNI
jgi:outer membrane lipoprotein-sorting protein